MFGRPGVGSQGHTSTCQAHFCPPYQCRQFGLPSPPLCSCQIQASVCVTVGKAPTFSVPGFIFPACSSWFLGGHSRCQRPGTGSSVLSLRTGGPECCWILPEPTSHRRMQSPLLPPSLPWPICPPNQGTPASLVVPPLNAALNPDPLLLRPGICHVASVVRPASSVGGCLPPQQRSETLVTEMDSAFTHQPGCSVPDSEDFCFVCF